MKNNGARHSLRLFLFALLVSPCWGLAQPPELDHVIYGLFDYGCGEINYEAGIAIQARKLDGTPIASYRIGSDIDLPNQFVLRVPMALISGPNIASSGEEIEIVAVSGDGSVLFSNSHQVQDIGTFAPKDIGDGQGGDIATAGPDQYICTLTTTLNANTPVFGTGEWTLISGNGGLISEPTNPHSEFSGQIGETYQLKWTITNFGCPTTEDTVFLSFSDLLSLADAGQDLIICGSYTELAANIPLVGEGFWSILSGGNGTFEDPFDPFTTFYGEAGNTYVLQWEISQGECASSTDEVKIRLDAANSPDLFVDGPQSSFCTEGATLEASPGFDQYQWSHGPTTRVVHVDGVGLSTYTVTASMYNGCERVASHQVDFISQNPDNVEVIVGMSSYSICSQIGMPFQLSTSGVCGGNQPFTYEWVLIGSPPEGGLIETPSNPETTLIPYGTGIYTVQLTVRDTQNQEYSVTIPLVVPVLEDNDGDGQLSINDWFFRIAAWQFNAQDYSWLDADLNGTLNLLDLLIAQPCETSYDAAKTQKGGEK